MVLGESVSLRYLHNCGVLQGAVLYPVLFTNYMYPLAQLVCGFGVGCHEYAVDTQLYLLLDSFQTLPLCPPPFFEQGLGSCGWMVTT